MDTDFYSLGQYRQIPGPTSFEAAHMVSVPGVPFGTGLYNVQPIALRTVGLNSYTAPSIPANSSLYGIGSIVAGNLGSGPGYTQAPTSGIYTGIGGGNPNGMYSPHGGGACGASGTNGNPY